jgi:hypothetical protein
MLLNLMVIMFNLVPADTFLSLSIWNKIIIGINALIMFISILHDEEEKKLEQPTTATTNKKYNLSL